jgi:hypothetical protein
MPSVTVRSNPSGLPMAKTRSPTARASALPIKTNLNLGLVLVLDLQQGQIGKLVHRHDADLFVGLAFQLPVG